MNVKIFYKTRTIGSLLSGTNIHEYNLLSAKFHEFRSCISSLFTITSELVLYSVRARTKGDVCRLNLGSPILIVVSVICEISAHIMCIA